MSLMFAEQMFLPTEPFPSSLVFLLKIKNNGVYVYMHVCGDTRGGQVCQISLELHLQAVVNCPVWSGRRANTLTEPLLQASPPSLKAKVCLGLKDAEAKLTGVPGTIAFFRSLAKRRSAFRTASTFHDRSLLPCSSES